MFVRQMHYLVALAREEHFGRAAAACHVTQPTLSAGIRKLEQELGVPIVARGHRFLGFTAEGERVLGWARQIAADYESLKQEKLETGSTITGTLRVGAIPAATAAAPALLAPFRDRHPGVKVQMLTLSSAAIQRGLDAMELDAGITYLDNEPLNRVRRVPLYREHYVFITRPDEPLARRRSLRWAEAAAQPLCLLTPDMQNRRIIALLLQFGERNPGMVRVMVGDALVFEHERLQQRMNQFFDRIESTLRQCLRATTAASSTPTVDAQVAANVLTAFVVGRLQGYARSGFRRLPTEHLEASLALML